MDHKTNQTKQIARPTNGGTIDGFTRVSRGTALQPLAPLRPKPKLAPSYVAGPAKVAQSSPAAARKPHSPGATIVPHAPQHATTLMRSAVKKPDLKSAKVIKSQSPTDLPTKSLMQTVAPKMSFTTINPVRHLRAERMVKSPAVSRYSPSSVPSQASSNGRLAPSSASSAQQTSYSTPTHSSTANNSAYSEVRAVRSVQRQNYQTTPTRQTSVTEPKPDIFELAMAEAISHEQTYDHRPARTKKRGRVLRFAAGGVVALFLIGFLAYHNAPSLSLEIASYRAGLHVSLPAHQPAGFALGYLEYQPGNVTANFNSPKDGRQYNITQKASSWDSQALLSNFVAGASSAYKTYQRAGRTVYLIGNNTATWVDSGVWYTVDGNSSLSSNQLLDLASSM